MKINWKKVENETFLKEGTVCRTENYGFVIIGELNTSFGTNDEFTEKVTHYTEDWCKIIDSILKISEKDFNKTTKL